MGMSFLAIADGDTGLAAREAHGLATLAWSRRNELEGDAVAVADALERATDGRAGPVLLLDTGDNIGAGSPGDSVALLAEARRRHIAGYLETICDPRAVARCIEAGEGAEVEVAIGGHGAVTRPPAPCAARCARWHPDRSRIAAPTHGGFRSFDTGATAVLETEQGQTLVLTSRAIVDCSIERHRTLGLDPARAR